MNKKLIVEAIGTFFLVFTIALIVTAANPAVHAPLAIGSVLMVMVYAGGHISGAHYNPAVSLAIWLRGLMTASEMFAYWGAQFAGAIVAALLGKFFAETLPQPTTLDVMYSALGEFVFTFALAYVVLNVATAKGNEGNSFFGLAIGFTVFAAAVSVGPISGAILNPAVAIGVTILHSIPVASLPMYLIATFAGGAAAALVFRALDLGNDKATTSTATEQAELAKAGAPRR